ncbi:MAG: hypothetical protein ABJF65_00295 [Reichenbachiella sp.]|uniref:hypothetical protein n=1 Tax=Reichenbachiella sp. TaxID=2184521 RepID=UPI0032678C84
MQKQPTEVIFRKYKTQGDLIALFPYEIESYLGDVSCYQHVGQHGNAHYPSCIQRTVPASDQEVAALKQELEIYYDYKLILIKRRSHKKFLRTYTNIFHPNQN